jgi:hypothetical protein
MMSIDVMMPVDVMLRADASGLGNAAYNAAIHLAGQANNAATVSALSRNLGQLSPQHASDVSTPTISAKVSSDPNIGQQV